IVDSFQWTVDSGQWIVDSGTVSRVGLWILSSSVVNYPLSLVNYPLSLVNCPLSLVNYPLSIIPYPLSIVNCQLMNIVFDILDEIRIQFGQIKIVFDDGSEMFFFFDRLVEIGIYLDLVEEFLLLVWVQCVVQIE